VLVIRTATSFLFLASWCLSLACAKGTEINPTDIVILPLLPAPTVDAGVDAGAAPEAEIVADPPVE
jgi:hypothetical protein